MPFDIDRLYSFALSAIRDFSKDHQDETFYRFAITDRLLCLNSVEKFRDTLKFYQERWADNYATKEQISDLRNNTGDWEYLGFAEFTAEDGFDHDAHDHHYNVGLDDPDSEELKYTEYARAMNTVLDRLMKANAFDCLKRTLDFSAVRVEHNY